MRVLVPKLKFSLSATFCYPLFIKGNQPLASETKTCA